MEKTDPERIQECKMAQYWKEIEDLDGLPITDFFELQNLEDSELFDVYRDYVVDGKLPLQLRQSIKSTVVPFKIKKSERNTVRDLENEAKEKLGTDDIVLLAIKDENSESWSLKFMAETDILDGSL